MPDEETREEPEVEGHGHAGDVAEGHAGDLAEGHAGARDDDDDVEAHIFPEGHVGGHAGGHVGGHAG